MNVRTDSYHVAGWKRADALRGCDVQHPHTDNRDHVAHQRRYTEPVARTGDVWTLRQWTSGEPGPVNGYALVCPNEDCEQGVHGWQHARDCGRTDCPGCWTWTGLPEDDTLTASPSLWVKFGCGWHGWLRSGTMVGA